MLKDRQFLKKYIKVKIKDAEAWTTDLHTFENVDVLYQMVAEHSFNVSYPQYSVHFRL
jgi:hypothetical protein